MISKQETFDTVCKALIAQGKPAVAVNGYGGRACRYRTEDGCKCAAGHLIPDDKYNPALEGYSLGDNRVAEAIGDHDRKLVGALQALHDDLAMHHFFDGSVTRQRTDAEWLVAFKEAAQDYAERHGLDPAVLL